MDDGTTQGSPLSPVLWLIYLAKTLKGADARFIEISTTPTPYSSRLRCGRGREVTIEVSLFSYADDVNTLVVTRGTSARQHRRMVKEVDTILEEEGAKDRLRWDPSKESTIEFSVAGEAATLGRQINWKLNFQPHVNSRTKNAEQLLNVMSRLSNSNGGISPRALYTCAIRPILTWGAELWNGPHTTLSISAMERVEYTALRKITGAYRGSSKVKLGQIPAVETLKIKLDDSWAARSLRTGDRHIREFLDAAHSAGTTRDRTTRLPGRRPHFLSVLPFRHKLTGVKALWGPGCNRPSDNQ